MQKVKILEAFMFIFAIPVFIVLLIIFQTYYLFKYVYDRLCGS